MDGYSDASSCAATVISFHVHLVPDISSFIERESLLLSEKDSINPDFSKLTKDMEALGERGLVAF